MKKRLTRRFIINNIEKLELSNPLRYERYYINESIRIQRKNDIYEKETLSNNIVIKKEKIDINEFNNLKKQAISKIIRDSYLYLKDDRVSIKKYYDIYEGLIRVEVKFKDEIEMNQYKKEEWMGEEITDSLLAFDKDVSKLNKDEFLKEINTYTNRKQILDNVEKLIKMHKSGKLGGEVMPEDANPKLRKSSIENYLYFTLPMALNYQRNSYTLWKSALNTFEDIDTKFVFNPKECIKRSFEEVQSALVKYKLALQKQKQTEIWIKLCKTFIELFDGDIRKLFEMYENDVDKIRDYIQKDNKKKFPYLSGNKICNYWLYVIYEYTDTNYKNIEKLTVAPDTHVCKATFKLGLINEEEFNSSNVQLIVIDRWQKLFNDTRYKPIDIHTPLWLWSRNGFKEIE